MKPTPQQRSLEQETHSDESPVNSKPYIEITESLFPCFDVLGTPVSLTSYDQLFDALKSRLGRVTTTVAFCNVHSVMSARADEHLADALSGFDVANPDGIPLVWALRRLHGLPAVRVYGPTFMRVALERGQAQEWRHFLLGTTEETLQRLASRVSSRYPDVRIAGTYSPPFRDLTEEDLEEITSAIRESDADLVWVGMGMPKQELLIPCLTAALPGRALLGVGAAFDLLAGNQPEAPAWMQSRGLEWLYRLAHEPRRLWQRYLLNNPLFLILLTARLLNSRWRGFRFRESGGRREES